MREESNRVSCSSRGGNGQERCNVWLLFCGLGSYEYDGGYVCGSDRSLEICWLKEMEESKTKPILRADEQGRIG